MSQELSHRIDNAKISRISIDKVHARQGPFTMSYGFSLDLLKASLKAVGVLNPPLLMESGAGGFIIISGYRRITALLELGFKYIPARVLEYHQVPPLNAFLINFYDNLATREFNPVEKGMILARLATYLTEDQLLAHYMVLLGLPPRRSTLEKFISFDRNLDEPMKQALAHGTITESTATALLALPTKERKAVAAIFLKITFNMNQQKQLIELLTDISRITGVSIAEMLRSKPFIDIVTSRSMNRPQKARALLSMLRSRRLPRLTRAEETFKKRIAKLGLPRQVRIQAPPYFESGLYRMEISFQNGQELKDAIDLLGDIEGLREIQDPWEGTE